MSFSKIILRNNLGPDLLEMLVLLHNDFQENSSKNNIVLHFFNGLGSDLLKMLVILHKQLSSLKKKRQKWTNVRNEKDNDYDRN